MLNWSDDPVRDWDRYCDWQEKQMEKYPICASCEERILDDYCYLDDDGYYYCEKCFEDMHRVETPVYDEEY